MAVRQMLVADRYRLLEPVGAGGMGRVWLARDEMLHRDVAVKEIIPPDWMTDAEQVRLRERTLREARSAARLNHPNVVRIYDVVHADGLSWIVMEYVPSRSLHQVLHDQGPYDPAIAARIGLAVLDALDAAHQAGVLHRDIKPHNVLIGTDGRVVLTDFGLATFVDDGSVTAPGLIVGSPQYVSPERAREGASTVESDLWSLGATLYAAVEGRSPYARDTAMATLAALATEPPDPPVRAGPLTPVLDGLLRYEPATRLTVPEIERRLHMIVFSGSPETPFMPGRRDAGRERARQRFGGSPDTAGEGVLPAASGGSGVGIPADDAGLRQRRTTTPPGVTRRGPAAAAVRPSPRSRARPIPVPSAPPSGSAASPPPATPVRVDSSASLRVPDTSAPVAAPDSSDPAVISEPPVSSDAGPVGVRQRTPEPGRSGEPAAQASVPQLPGHPGDAPATVQRPAPQPVVPAPRRVSSPRASDGSADELRRAVQGGEKSSSPSPSVDLERKDPDERAPLEKLVNAPVPGIAERSVAPPAKGSAGRRPPGEPGTNDPAGAQRPGGPGLIEAEVGGAAVVERETGVGARDSVEAEVPGMPDRAATAEAGPGDEVTDPFPAEPVTTPSSRPPGKELVLATPASAASGRTARRFRPVRGRVARARLAITGLVVLFAAGSLLTGYVAELDEPRPRVFFPSPESTVPSLSASSGSWPSPGPGAPLPTGMPGFSAGNTGGPVGPGPAGPLGAGPSGTPNPAVSSGAGSSGAEPSGVGPSGAAGPAVSSGAGPAGVPAPAGPATVEWTPFSPVVCDRPPPAGLPRTPRKGAARGVNGWKLQAGWSYFNDGSGFHIAVPDGWSYQRTGDTYCFRSPRNTRVLSLDTGRDPAADPLAAARAEARRLVDSKSLPGYSPVAITPVPLLNKTADWEYRYRSAAGTARHAGVRWFVLDGRGYALGWNTPERTWSADLLKIQLIRATFYAERAARAPRLGAAGRR